MHLPQKCPLYCWNVVNKTDHPIGFLPNQWSSEKEEVKKLTDHARDIGSRYSKSLKYAFKYFIRFIRLWSFRLKVEKVTCKQNMTLTLMQACQAANAIIMCDLLTTRNVIGSTQFKRDQLTAANSHNNFFLSIRSAVVWTRVRHAQSWLRFSFFLLFSYCTIFTHFCR